MNRKLKFRLNRHLLYLVMPCALLMLSVIYAQQTQSYLSQADRNLQTALKLSYLAESQGDYEGAIEVLSPLIWERSRTYVLQARLGWLYAMQGENTKAINHYKEAIRLAPTTVECRVGIMLPLIQEENYRDAEFYGKQAISLDPGNYWATLRLCYTRRMQGEYDSTRILATRMLKKYPADVNYLVELAYAYAGKRDTRSARKIFKQVLLYDSGNQWALAYLQVTQ